MPEHRHEGRAALLSVYSFHQTADLSGSILSGVIAWCPATNKFSDQDWQRVEPATFMGTRNYYDRNSNLLRAVAELGVVVVIAAFMASSFWWSEDKFFVLCAALSVPVIMLGLPRAVRSVYLACMGEPALRINDEGFWARDWSYLGMISWRNVASVEIETYKIQYLVVHLRDNEFARLTGRDQVSIMLARWVGYLFFTDAGSNTLRLISSFELRGSWEEFVTTLDAILAANGVSRSNRVISR